MWGSLPRRGSCSAPSTRLPSGCAGFPTPTVPETNWWHSPRSTISVWPTIVCQGGRPTIQVNGLPLPATPTNRSPPSASWRHRWRRVGCQQCPGFWCGWCEWSLWPPLMCAAWPPRPRLPAMTTAGQKPPPGCLTFASRCAMRLGRLPCCCEALRRSPFWGAHSRGTWPARMPPGQCWNAFGTPCSTTSSPRGRGECGWTSPSPRPSQSSLRTLQPVKFRRRQPMNRLRPTPQEACRTRRLCKSCTKYSTRGWLHDCDRCFLILEGADTVKVTKVSTTASALLRERETFSKCGQWSSVANGRVSRGPPADDTARVHAAAGVLKTHVCVSTRACRVR
mmetsp:Transcript_9205/g.27646  ORF Transcript_9205/g.27646 Transcript_9205/m.27646 type:complete len:336 (+) Transcript_9205:199-1206(+)